MTIATLGQLTFNTRVEAWECDHNNHWNVRNFLRSMQSAGHVAADICGAAQMVRTPWTMHARFHRELFQSTMAEVRSAVLADGPHAGAVVHVLSAEGRLSATALEYAGYDAGALPSVTSEEVRLALPRSVDATPHHRDAVQVPASAWRVEHGMVQSREVDHTGTLSVDRIMRRVATASSDLLASLGFTPDFVRTQQISRMGVEIMISRLSAIPVGMRLSGTARITAIKGKSVIIRHQIFSPDGCVVAAADQCVVAVDMRTRRVTDVPDFLVNAAAA